MDTMYKPQVMGVLNVTPDSFADQGLYFKRDTALRHALLMIDMGATIIDIGGESTRPGANLVSQDEELSRVIPVIDSLRNASDVMISIDTYKPVVMREALSAGAVMVNDVKALNEPGALTVIADQDVKVCLMHMQNDPLTMQDAPSYPQGLINEIKIFFTERIAACTDAGIKKSQLLIDPGFGFGKTTQQNMQLINQLSAFDSLGIDVLIGASRKNSIGKILNLPVAERLNGSLALAVLAIANGAKIIRTHDVKETFEAIMMAWAVCNELEVVE